MYFAQFPQLVYDLGGQKRLVTNITRSIERNDLIVADNLLFNKYYIRDAARPDIVANELYGHPKYHWILFVVGKITPNDWPLTTRQIEEYIDTKYGDSRNDVRYYLDDKGVESQRFQIQNFQDADGNTIEFYEDGDGLGATVGNVIVANGDPVTNEQYERDRNEAKRTIEVLNPDYLGEFITDFKRLARG